MRNWEGAEEEKHRVAGYILAGLKSDQIVESPYFYFTDLVGGQYVGCAEAIALTGMLGNVRSAYGYFYDHRTKYTGNMSPWQDFADLLRISPWLARQIDWYHSRGIDALTIAVELTRSSAADWDTRRATKLATVRLQQAL